MPAEGLDMYGVCREARKKSGSKTGAILVAVPSIKQSSP